MNKLESYYLKLAAMGMHMWNRWARSVMTPQQIDSLNWPKIRKDEFKKIADFDIHEKEKLCSKLGLGSIEEISKDVVLGGLSDKLNFKGFIFPGRLIIEDSKIIEHSSFSSAVFCGDVRFTNVEFVESVEFIETIFNAGLEFFNTRFKTNGNFREAQMLLDGKFSSVIFNGNANFSGVKCYGDLVFYDVMFKSEANFLSTKFYTGLVCAGASFNDNAIFESAEFHDEANFDEAEFNKGADFNDVKFHGLVGFNNAVFGENTSFNYSKFESFAGFKGAMFKGMVFFNDADFQSVRFSEAVFVDDVSFQGADFFKSVDFDNAKFISEAIFTNAKFMGGTVFSNVVFNDPPRFHNVNLHQDTTFYDAKYINLARDESDMRAWRTLKLSMNKTHHHDQELLYFSYEMDAKRVVLFSGKHYAKWFLLSLYKWLSNYGKSLVRPTSWLIVVWVVFALFYREVGWSNMCINTLEAFQISFSGIMPLVPASGKVISSLINHQAVGLGLQVAMALQNVFSAILLFLIGLALRHLFSIK